MDSLIAFSSRLAGAVHVLVYRATGGRVGSRMLRFDVLLLTTTGRRSGKSRTTPLGYFEYDGGYVITASNGGSGRNPAWYYNLKAEPAATIQMKDRVVHAVSTEATGAFRDLLWVRLVDVAPSYGPYAKRTTRTIPMFLLRPNG